MHPFKTLETKIKDIDEKGIVTFYYNAFNNIDSDNDIAVPGSHRKSQQENATRIKHFKNHNVYETPGVIKEMGEDHFGAWARSQLILGSTKGRDTFEEYKAGAITEHSFGYDVIKSDMEGKVRKIKEFKVWEVSSLTGWGANPNTPVIDIKNEKQAIEVLEILMRLQKGQFSDDYLSKIEAKIKEVNSHIKSLFNQPDNSTVNEPKINLSELIEKKCITFFKTQSMEFDVKGLELTLEKVNQKLAATETAIAGKADQKSLGEIQLELKEAKGMLESLSKVGDIGAEKNIVEYVKASQAQCNALESEVKELKNAREQAPVSIKSELDRLVKSDAFKSFKGGQNANFELKSQTVHSTTNSFTQTNSPIIQYQRDPIIGVSPLKDLVLQRISAQRSVGMSDYIDWIERTTDTNAAAMTLEAGQYAGGNSSNLAWTSYKVPVEKITDLALVTKEKLDDTDFIQSEIMTVLNENIPFKLEAQLFDGTGVSPQLFGLIGGSLAKAFSAPTGTSGAVDKANMYSCLKAAILQVNLGDTSKPKNKGFIPTVCLVDPVSYFLLSETKDDQGQYLFGSDGVPRVLGIPIVMTQFLAADTYLVGDFTKAELYMRSGLAISMYNQHASIAEYGQVAFMAEMRCAYKVKYVNRFAFVTGTFTNTKSAILKTIG